MRKFGKFCMTLSFFIFVAGVGATAQSYSQYGELTPPAKIIFIIAGILGAIAFSAFMADSE